MNDRIILITGASSGIGRACAEFLAQKGYRVFGTTRREDLVGENHGGRGFELISMDVADRESVARAVRKVIAKAGGIDIIINNAGMGIAGSIEDTSYEEAKMQFDTNFFGCMNVINEVLPHMRKRGSGFIINIGSVAGYISIPHQAMYSATKAALQSMTFSLRNELAHFNIKVSIVHPGDLRTNFTQNRKRSESSVPGSVYYERMERSIAVMERDEQNGGDPVCVAHTIHRILKRKNPPVAVTVGLKYKLIAFLLRIVPVKLREKAIASIYA
ncbi:MAG: SDR family oxidoreductase [Clostridia bacterium]